MSIKIIDGKDAVLGRLASFAAKEALKGSEIVVVNSESVIISGNLQNIQQEFHEQRSRFGHSQKGPIHHKATDKMVKRVIRGMIPNYREGRGREAFKRVKCYIGIPKEYQDVEKIKLNHQRPRKFSRVNEFLK
ncbi:MAG: Ribosomal protein L13 [archaeon GW2011_AR13]|nr:MAG: Ribosomal protein L13 [archaeon GW2011_AR13]HIG93988.1 50S ribosomal protein L13 [Nanoarchaeota archaeon]HIH63820.1 50S ribosomal protein L13 [Nanoarchaeota archaeon]HIJ09115.1 50S ribosomal protein L13 [Nanoarchaeota archaeon]